jgi:predicted N-acetyltransferase YhbS
MRASEHVREAGPGTGRVPEIRELREDDDLDAELDLGERAFGLIDDGDRPGWLDNLRASVRTGRVLGVFDGSALIGTARFHDMRQWWHGRSLPMAGVAGVKIAPEERGRGVGKALVTRLLAVIAARGYPVSALFPSTAPIYRSLGWEVAGGLYEMVLPARSLSPLLAPDSPLATPDAGRPELPPAVRRAGPDDAAEVIAVTGRVHEAARDCGPNTRDVEAIRRWLGDRSVFTYLAPDGFLAYGWQSGNDEIMVRQASAGSAGTTRALWGIVASHASMAKTVRAWLGPQDPIGWLTREPEAEVALREAWMLRVVDAPAAISARGFPAAAALSVTLRLDDAALPANSGLWKLEVSGGQGTLTPFETESGPQLPPAGPVRLGARGFAALYAGTPLPTLRRAGLAADGDPDADAALDCAFAGTPFMADHF